MTIINPQAPALGRLDTEQESDAVSPEVSVVANAIAWSFFGKPEVAEVEVSDKNIGKAVAAAKLALAHLEDYRNMLNGMGLNESLEDLKEGR